MPLLICPRCQRANPAQAVYCYFDGNLLRADAVRGTAATGLLSDEFVFPSKRRCKTLDDFVQGCQYEWEDACELLKKGEFARYFVQVGRQDLARAARDAEKQADPDVALHTFLSALPATQVKGPKLDIKPRRILLNKVKPGDVKQIPVTILNEGKGLLQGKLTVSEGGHWMRIAFGGDSERTPIKTAQEQEVLFVVDARTLAAPASYNARLTIVTNGGVAEVPVRMDLGSTPFAIAPFKGASSPRDMAERMRANPKAAAPLLESGEIQKWFVANGWAFPSMVIPTRGIAAVQQFFEGMGLSRPPQLQLSEPEVSIFCVPPEVVQKQVIVYTPQKKWVYAHAETDAYWLRILTPYIAGGQQAALQFEVDSSLMDEGQSHQAFIHLTGNAGQQLTIRVVVDVQRPPRRFLGLFGMVLVAVLYRLLIALPGDLFARVLATGVREPPPGTMARWSTPAADEEGYLRMLVILTWWVGTLAGTLALWRRSRQPGDAFTGAVAGTMAAAAVAITLGCLVTLLDFTPRLLVSSLASGGMEPAVATILWLVIVLSWWGLLGAGIGFILASLGRRGRRVQALAAWPFARFLESVGMPGAADYLRGSRSSRGRAGSLAGVAWGGAGPVAADGGVTRKG